MAQTPEGARKVSAEKAGMTVRAYTKKIKTHKLCSRCKKWRLHDAYCVDNSRYGGLNPTCRTCTSQRNRGNYVPRQRQRGRRYAAARDGDREQARGRVNHLVRMGILPRPSEVPCVVCGHLGDGPRHEYDHYKGYAAENHETVEVVCAKCHGKRNPKAQQTHCIHGHEFTPENTIRKANGGRSCRECRRAHDRKRRPASYWREWRRKKRENGSE